VNAGECITGGVHSVYAILAGVTTTLLVVTWLLIIVIFVYKRRRKLHSASRFTFTLNFFSAIFDKSILILIISEHLNLFIGFNFIAHLHSFMNATPDIDIAIPSVRLCVRPYITGRFGIVYRELVSRR